MAKTNKKLEVAESVYELALQRMRLTFARYDHVAVSFSGGKDSTAAMQVALTVARELNRLPLHVFTYDEEAIPPQTVEYMDRLRQSPEIRFEWFCLPVKHRNACSTKSPFWYCWDDEQQDKWVRSLPEGAIHSTPWFKRGMETITASKFILPPTLGTVALVMGIRCQESLTRYYSVASKSGFECFTMPQAESPWISKVYPVYDWTLDDVWVAPQKFGWDYNKAYDLMEMQGVPRPMARCSPPFGEQPIRRLHTFKTCWPELWGKMVDRVPGAATAARYANTELYGVGVQDEDKPGEMTWQQATLEKLEALEPESKRDVAKAIAALRRDHANALKRSGYTVCDVPDAVPHEVTGHCWKHFFVIASVGGDKLGRQSQRAMNKAIKTRKRNGLCVRGNK